MQSETAFSPPVLDLIAAAAQSPPAVCAAPWAGTFNAFLAATGLQPVLEGDGCTFHIESNAGIRATGANCTEACDETSTAHFGDRFVHGATPAPVVFGGYCPVSKGAAWAALLDELEKHGGTTTCVYSPVEVLTGGAFQCTSTNEEERAAFEALLNGLAAFENRACSCPTAGGRTNHTTECSGNGVCQTDVALVQSPPMGTSQHNWRLAKVALQTPAVEGAQCTCADGYSRPACSGQVPTECPAMGCLNGGTCGRATNFQCRCPNGWTGTMCQTAVCPYILKDGTPTLCSGNGSCRFSVCDCNQGFWGSACQHGHAPVTKAPTKGPAPTSAQNTPAPSHAAAPLFGLSRHRTLLYAIVAVLVAGLLLAALHTLRTHGAALPRLFARQDMLPLPRPGYVLPA